MTPDVARLKAESSVRPDGSELVRSGPGLRPRPSAEPTSRWRERRRVFASILRRLGRQRSPGAGQGAEAPGGHPRSSTARRQADLAGRHLVLGGDAAIEKAANKAGYRVEVPFKPGRADASQDQTDLNSFAVLKPTADAFRNYYAPEVDATPAEMMVDKANILTLTVPEMVAFVGGLSVLKANAGARPTASSLSTRGFEQRLLRQPARHVDQMGEVQQADALYEGHDRKTGKFVDRNAVTWCSARTPSCGPSRRSMPRPTARIVS